MKTTYKIKILFFWLQVSRETFLKLGKHFPVAMEYYL